MKPIEGNVTPRPAEPPLWPCLAAIVGAGVFSWTLLFRATRALWRGVRGYER